MLAKWAPTEGGGHAAAGERGKGAGGGSLLLPRDVIHVTFVRSNFRSSGIASGAAPAVVVPEFVIDMLLESNVASIFGDGRGPRGRRRGAPWPLYKTGGPLRTAPPVCGQGLPLIHPVSVALLSRPPPGLHLCSWVDGGSGGHLQFRPGSALQPLALVWVGHIHSPPLQWPLPGLRQGTPPTHLPAVDRRCLPFSGEGVSGS